MVAMTGRSSELQPRSVIEVLYARGKCGRDITEDGRSQKAVFGNDGHEVHPGRLGISP